MLGSSHLKRGVRRFVRVKGLLAQGMGTSVRTLSVDTKLPMVALNLVTATNPKQPVIREIV